MTNHYNGSCFCLMLCISFQKAKTEKESTTTLVFSQVFINKKENLSTQKCTKTKPTSTKEGKQNHLETSLDHYLWLTILTKFKGTQCLIANFVSLWALFASLWWKTHWLMFLNSWRLVGLLLVNKRLVFNKENHVDPKKDRTITDIANQKTGKLCSFHMSLLLVNIQNIL